MAALFKLIHDARAGMMTVDMYVLKYTAITKVLVEKNVLSKFHRNVRILEGLSDDIRLQAGFRPYFRRLANYPFNLNIATGWVWLCGSD